jgi:uncharacterized membrane protein
VDRRFADQLTSGLGERLIGAHVPGLGLVTTMGSCWRPGAIASNVSAGGSCGAARRCCMQVPVFRTVYAPVKQLIDAFSPTNELGFKRMVLVEDPARGFVLGFLTRVYG